MRRAGIPRLLLVGEALPPHLSHLTDAESMAEVIQSFPDKNGWLPLLARHVRAADVGALLRGLSAEDTPVELLSMRCCLFCGVRASTLPSVAELRARIAQYCAEYGIVPSPATVLAEPWQHGPAKCASDGGTRSSLPAGFDLKPRRARWGSAVLQECRQ